MPRRQTFLDRDARSGRLSPNKAAAAKRVLEATTALASEIEQDDNSAHNPGKINRLSEEEAISYLVTLVKSGAAGRDAPYFIKTVLDIQASLGGALGPPNPRTEEEIYERLARLFAALDPEIVRTAIRTWEAAQREPAPSAPEPIQPPEPLPESPEDPEIESPLPSEPAGESGSGLDGRPV